MFVWGRKVLPLGPAEAGCDQCGTALQMALSYRYFGLFWLGVAFDKELFGHCVLDGSAWRFDRPAEATDRLVSWNYRYGWAVWAAIFAMSAFSGS